MAEELDHLLPAIAAGEPDAYARWLARAEPRVRDSLGSFCSQLDVEAVVQECLLRVWQVAPRVVPDGKPNALLRLAIRIARNLAVSELRRRRVRPETVEHLARIAETRADLSAQPHPPDPFLRERIVACREQLPSKPAQALQARLEGAGRPDRELAAGLAMKLNTFLQNVGRARKLLAECLRRAGVDLQGELT